ncbi:unnamed protein product [Cunninghamella blakesleeana]
MPWYTNFKQLILSLRGITEHETFDHPVATMIVISSANPDPMGTIMQLYNPNVPSFTVDKPYVDTNILRYYVLIHDPQQTTLEYSQSVFEKMKRSFGLHCHMLTLSSHPPTSFEDSANIDNNLDLADESIHMIWKNDLEQNQNIDTALYHYTQQLDNNNSSNNNNMDKQEQLINLTDAPSSPTISSLTRSSSSSSIATNVTSPLPTVMTSAQGFDLTNNYLDQSIPSSPSNENNPKSLPNNSIDLLTDTISEVPNIKYGQYLTYDNIEGTKNMVKEFVVQSLVPFMERNIQHWNEQVASARRGLTGRLFGASRRLFGTNNSRGPLTQSIQTIPATGRNIPTGTNMLTIYPFGAPEAQMRKLADFAFMLRDYKFAQIIYDTVRRDYATDKAYKYHAATQEMIGICYLMTNQPITSKVDIDRNFELAVQQYLGRCRSPYHATRTTVIYYELLKLRRMWKEIPNALVRMTGEDSDLRSALFLEQAAHCFLHNHHPMVRKYGFHLVMAGHRYAKGLQRNHAFRCYKMAALVLDESQWSVAKSHVQFALGRQAYNLGQLEDAITYFLNVLPDSKQTPQQQITHIREFLFIYKNYATQAEIDPLKETLPDLNIPIIIDKNIRVSLSNNQVNTDNQDEWIAMERDLLESSIKRGYIMKSKKALALQQQDDNRVICAIGEPSIVQIEIYNPLQIAVSLSEIILGCRYRNSTKASNESVDSESYLDENMIEGTPVEGSDDMFAFDEFNLQKISQLSLEPSEKRVIELTVIPQKEGSITIVGLHYTLNDLVHTFRPFHKKGKRLNSTKEERMSVVYAPDRSLDILVTSPMPLLDLAFHNVPDSIFSGEVVQTILEINNKGNKGLTSLQLKSSHPSFISVGKPQDMDKPIYGTGEDKGCQFDNQIYDPSILPISLPSDGDSQQSIVQPGKTTLVPFWIRGDRIGKFTIKFLFSYQSEEENSAIAHRTLRYTITIQVLPSLKINAFTRPSMSAVNEFILGIEIENLQSVANFELRQLTSASASWLISPLNINMGSSQDISSKTTTPIRQTTFTYYKIRKIEDDSKPQLSPEAWTSNALSNLLANSDKFDPPPPLDMNITKISFKNEVIPYYTTPLKDFALNSRIHWRTNHLQNQFPMVSAKKQPDVFTLYNTSDIDLTLYWDIPNMKKHGHHYIIGVNLGVVQNPYQEHYNGKRVSNANSGRSLFEQTAKEKAALVNSLTKNLATKEESPIKLTVHSLDAVKHDFNENGLLTVPVRFTLKNCSWNKQAKYKLDLLSFTEGRQVQLQKVVKSALDIHIFHWNGSTTFSGSLKSNESINIEAIAMFQVASTYDINRWKLTVQTTLESGDEDGEVYVHWPSLPHIISIA